jgi:hypothetical protein
MVFWAGVHMSRALLRRRRRRLAGELGLQVGTSEKRARRGGEVEALVTISSTKGLGEVDVGLVCTESYDVEVSSGSTSQYGSSTIRETRTAIAHEAWQPVETILGVQSVRIAIPPEAPFSYAGSCLSFKWEVAARGRRAGHVDAQARSEISVLP